MNGDKSSHIMNASTNLVGFTFIVLTSLKAFHLGRSVLVDKLVVLSVTGFMISTLFSFLSIRTHKKGDKSAFYEMVADYIFFGSLLMMFLVCILLTIYD